MRVLILSASTGGGHNSTAEALADPKQAAELIFEGYFLIYCSK